ncbi:MAG: hypothetical protein A3D94_16360 [Alphaproteobacteria bacterium RIFCSPHIGHO2_12_FULL_66_14]|jgi:CubicO group peptidase (beta-lactamase class C family)|nr:MAG: hypothetical protein A3D94_16360 [Alphaproteobacteria bacterium RIFCSPHIGHO2_12_FULL_66_14]
MNDLGLQRRHFLAAAVAAGLAGKAATAMAERGNPRMTYEGRSIDEMIADFMTEHAIPGMSLAIVQAPYITRVTGYGVADVDKRLLVATHTLFDLGQMVEAYSNVAIMQLVETGKLGLGDQIGARLPDLPAAWRAIMVRQLLTRASGIVDYTRHPSFDPSSKNHLGHAIELVGDRPLAFKPGTDVATGATDHSLLVRLVEAASGQRYDDFIRINQFERLGLHHTMFAAEAAKLRSEAVENNGNRHQAFLADSTLINPTERATGYRSDNSVATAGGSALLASAMDVSVWDIGLAGGILVKDAALRAMLYSPTTLDNARTVPLTGGWRFPGRKGLMYIVGQANGQSAFLSRFTAPSELVCVTLLANKEGIDLTQLARRIAGAYDTKLGPPAVDCVGIQQSPYSVAETLKRFDAIAKAVGVDPTRTGATVKAWEQDGQVWICFGGGSSAAASQKAILNKVLLGAVSH